MKNNLIESYKIKNKNDHFIKDELWEMIKEILFSFKKLFKTFVRLM